MDKKVEITDCDRVDILQDGLLKMWHTYCGGCGKQYSQVGKSIDVAIDLFEKGWRKQLIGNAYCPECVVKYNPPNV